MSLQCGRNGRDEDTQEYPQYFAAGRGMDADSSVKLIEQLMADDDSMLALANKKRVDLFESPTQSEFRVFALLTVVDASGRLLLVEGANTEQGYIGGAICAERSALSRLRMIDRPVIKQVTVVTDSVSPLSPGALCREYLMSHCNLDTIVLMGNADGDKKSKCVIGDLWPHPYQYRKLRRDEVVPHAERFSSTMKRVDALENTHPSLFAAAVLFTDGSIETSYQLNGIEYGCTLDAVSQLIREMEKRLYCQDCGSPPVRPVALAMVDQFGVAHGPFAAARSLLSEHGYGYVQVLIHDSSSGEFVLPTVEDLIPQPRDSHLLSCSDFR